MKITSVIQSDCDKCYICRQGGTLHPHHIMNGTKQYRKRSELYGLVIYVHDLPCHRIIHDHNNNLIKLKQIGQYEFEKTHSREDFIELFGKSYL